MISDVSPLQGRTLDSMYWEYGNNNPFGALGPNVLKILKEIGWEIADKPDNIDGFYLHSAGVTSVSSNANADLESNSVKLDVKSINGFLLLLISIFIYFF